MKRFNRIIGAALILAVIASLFAVVAIAADDSYVILSKDYGQSVGLTDKSGGNTVGSTVTSNTSGGHSFKLLQNPTAQHDNANDYFSIAVSSSVDLTSTDASDYGYLVVDFDIATASEYFPMTLLTVMAGSIGDAEPVRSIDAGNVAIRGNALVGSYVAEDGSVTQVEYPLTADPLDWQHITMLYDLRNDLQVVYVDGVPVLRGSFLTDPSYEITNLYDTRLNIVNNQALPTGGASTAVTNAYAALYRQNDAMAECLAAEELLVDFPEELGLHYNIDYELPQKENVYRAGSYYSRDFDAALANSTDNTVELVYSWVGRTVTVKSECTVKTNGKQFSFDAPGYNYTLTQDADGYDVYSFFTSVQEYDVSFIYGTDTLSSGTYKAGSILTPPEMELFIESDGVTCVFLGWSLSEGGDVVEVNSVTSDATYYAVYSQIAYEVVTDIGTSTYYPTTATLASVVSDAPANSTIKFYVDASTPAANTTLSKSLTFDLNGHTLSTDGGKDASGNVVGRYTPKGGATLLFTNGTVKITNNELVYFKEGESLTGCAVFRDLNVVLASSRPLFECREGSATVDNIILEKTYASSCTLISVASRTGSTDGGEINITLKNTTIEQDGLSFISGTANSGEIEGYHLNVYLENSSLKLERSFIYASSRDAEGAAISTVKVTIDGTSSVAAGTAEGSYFIYILDTFLDEGSGLVLYPGAGLSQLPTLGAGEIVCMGGAKLLACSDTDFPYTVTDEYVTVSFDLGDSTEYGYFYPGMPTVAPQVDEFNLVSDTEAYQLLGWSAEAEGEVLAELPAATADTTYYAVWKDVSDQIYTIGFYNGTTLVTESNYFAGMTPTVPDIDSTYVQDGKLYYLLGWATTEGGEVVEVAAAAESINYYAVYEQALWEITDPDGNVTYYDSTKTFSSALGGSDSGSTVRMWGDVTINTNTIVKGKTLTIDLNGYTLSTASGSCRISPQKIDNKNCSHVTVKNGKVRIASSELFYLDEYAYRCSATLVDVEIVSSNRYIVEARSGDVTLERVIIKEGAFTGSATSLMPVAHRQSGVVTVNVTVKDSEIYCGARSFISSSPIAANGFKLNVNIQGSTVVCEGDYMISLSDTTAGAATSQLKLVADGGSKLAAKTGLVSILDTMNASSSVTLKDGVWVSAIPTMPIGTVTLPTDYKLVSTGDDTVPYALTTSYVTVAWDGALTYYVLGVTPKAPDLGELREENGRIYAFLGWSTAEGGEPCEIGVLTDSISYYSLWNDVTDIKYTVSYYEGDQLLGSVEYNWGSTPEGYAGAKSGLVVDGKTYILLGWTTEKGGSEAMELSPVKSDLSLYTVRVAGGYILTKADGSYEVISEDKSFLEAVALAKVNAGATLTLYCDGEFTSEYALNSASITIDLNGYTLITGGSKRFSFANGSTGNVTIKNGNVVLGSGQAQLFISNGAGNRITLDGLTVTTDYSSSLVDLRAGSVTIKNCDITTKSYVVSCGYRNFGAIYIDVDDSVINCGNHFANFANATSITSDEKSTPISITLTLTGSTVVANGNIIKLDLKAVRATHLTDGGATVTVDGGSRITCAGKLVAVTGSYTADKVSVTMAADTRFSSDSFVVVPSGTPFTVGGLSDFTLGMVDRSDFPYAAGATVYSITWRDSSTLTADLVESWLSGATPIAPDGVGYSFVPEGEIVAAEADAVYVGVYKLDEMKVQQNLTLYSDISFNVYITKVEGITSVTINGTEYDLDTADVWGNSYKLVWSSINPAAAGEALTVVITRQNQLGESVSATYTLSVASYARALLEGGYSDLAKTLVADLIRYIDAAYVTYGKTGEASYESISALADLVAEHESAPITEVESSADMTALSTALSSAQLYLDSSTRLRFNITAGYTGSIVLSVGDEVLGEYEITDGSCDGRTYIEISLRAYRLTEVISVKAGDATGSYDLAAYLNSVKGGEYESLVSALYSYALSAKAYKATVTEVNE